MAEQSVGASKIDRLSVEKLIPYAKNSRTHSAEQVAQIAASIKEFGFNNPVLIDEDNGIIAGHGRVMAAQKLGLQAVPCIRLAHLSDTQRKAYVIADNRLALNAGWDDQMLTLELQELDGEDFDLSLLGFEADELNALLNPIKETEGLTDEDAVPDVPEEPKTKPGDIYQLGRHRLMCGDSTSIDAVEKLMNGQLADILITDPPYNVAYERSNGLKIKNDDMGDDQFRQFLRDAFVAADTVMKSGAVFYIWHADSEGYNFRGACKDTNWTVRQCLIWNKDALVMGRQDYHWKHEPCLYGWKEGAGHLWATDRKQTTILEFKKPKRNDVHPTMKPVELIEYQLLNNTKGQDIVLDLFGGSGSTMIAAEKNGRTARLMELDPKYCDVIVKRWEDFTGQKAKLANFAEL
jgi:DNA modification methylase